MPGLPKLSWRAGWPLWPALLAGLLLAVTSRPRTGSPATAAGPLDDWDIPQLVAYLNGEGFGLRLVATRQDGVIDQAAFLTTTGQGWERLNRLPKDQKQIDQWQGTLYCERGHGGEGWADLSQHWGDCCLVVGPFLLYGDRALLGRVRDTLTALGQLEGNKEDAALCSGRPCWGLVWRPGPNRGFPEAPGCFRWSPP